MISLIYVLFFAKFLIQDGVNSKVILTHKSSDQVQVELKDKISNRTNTERSIRLFGTAADDCGCVNAICVMEKGEKVCQCLPEYGKLNNKECKACNCGEESNCTIQSNFFETEFITCICKTGYAEKSGTCVACNCGKDSNCTIESFFGRGFKTCICKTGYTEKSGTCVGPCTENPCRNGGTCTDVEKGYKCICSSEYIGGTCEEKKTAHLCNDGGGNGVCELLNAKCVLSLDDPKGYACTCEDGSIMDKYTAKCRPANPCNDQGGNEVCTLLNAECVLNSEELKGYSCICEERNIKDTDTAKCRSVHPCYDNGGKEACMALNAECVLNSNESVGFICVCNEGEVMDDDTRKCRSAHQCNDGGGNEVCKLINAQCVVNVEDPKGYTCECEDGNIRDKDTAKCRHVSNPDKCLNGKWEGTEMGSSKCKCDEGFTGLHCEEKNQTISIPGYGKIWMMIKISLNLKTK